MNIIYLNSVTLETQNAIAGSKRVLNQVRYLGAGNDVTVITVSKYKSSYPFNFNLKRFENNLLYIFSIPAYWIIICSFLIKKKVKGQNILLLPTVVDVNFVLPVFFSKLLGYKVVHDVVENFLIPGQERSVLQKCNMLVVRLFHSMSKYYTNGFIVISQGLYEKYRQFEKPLLKLYNSVEIKKDIVVHTSTAGVFEFVYSGTFYMKDGVKNLIQAFSEISKDYPSLKLTLTGKSTTNYFKECMAMIDNKNNIQYLGYLSPQELEEVYTSANVLLVTRDCSDYANFGFPFKLSEYLSYRKPVIASAVSDIPLLFADLENILLVEPSNVSSIAEKMRYAIENREDLDRIAKNGYEKCKEFFSIEKNGMFLNDFLQRLN